MLYSSSFIYAFYRLSFNSHHIFLYLFIMILFIQRYTHSSINCMFIAGSYTKCCVLAIFFSLSFRYHRIVSARASYIMKLNVFVCSFISKPCQTHMTNLRKFENENKIESTYLCSRASGVFGHTTWYICVYIKLMNRMMIAEEKKYKRYTEIKSDSRFHIGC